MPLVEVTLTTGRDPVAIRALIDRVHHAVVDSLGANPQSVRVIVREVPRTHWAAGNTTLAERDGAAAADVSAPPASPTATTDERK